MPRYLFLVAAVAAAVALAASTAVASTEAPASTHYGGTLADGAAWVSDVPSNWNGVLLLYSHGFGPLQAADAPSADSAAALLARGYALAGSSYDPNGSWWALQSAVNDQLQTIDAATANALPRAPRRVIAVGTSMGGLVSALEAERGGGRIDGALTTCGIVAGGIKLNNYQLDGEYVMTKLLATAPIQLVDFFPDFGAGIATGFALQAVANQAQTTPQGRARLALALAFLNATPAAPDQPARTVLGSGRHRGGPVRKHVRRRLPDHRVRQRGSPLDRDVDRRERVVDARRGLRVIAPTLAVRIRRRQSLPKGPARSQSRPQDAHGRRRYRRRPGRDRVACSRPRYRPAGCGCRSSHCTRSTIRLSRWRWRTSTRHGPRTPGRQTLLRQAYVDRFGHCAFSASEIVAGVEAVNHRVATGRWGSDAEPWKLQSFAEHLGLDTPAFVPYRPFPLSGDNGPFDPKENA